MQIERHGLNPVPLSEKTAGGADLFVIWAGASVCTPAFVIGALLVPAFSWNEALAINFLGNLFIGVLIVLGGYFGVKTGQPSIVWGRDVFGTPIGQWIPNICILFSMLGWCAVITSMAGTALNSIIADQIGVSFPLLFIFIVGLLNTFTAVAGYQQIRWLSWITVPVMIIICGLIAWKLLSLSSWSIISGYQPDGSLTYGAGLNLIIGGSLSGALIASDFSRYASNFRQSLVGSLLGSFLVSFLIGILGMASQAITGNWNPLLMIIETGMSSIVFVFLLFANWTTNDNLLYSSGLAMSNIFSLGRVKNTLICGIIATFLAMTGIAENLPSWLDFLSCALSPVLGVALTELFVTKMKKSYTPLNTGAVIAVLTGIVAAVLIPSSYVPAIAGLTVSSLVYLVISALLNK